MAEPSPGRRRIAIDGPAASGKSAVGTAVARTLRFTFIDTGAIYRALTWLVLHRQLDLARIEDIAALAARAAIYVRPEPDSVTSRVTIDGHDVTDRLRDADVEAAVSEVSAIPEVRRHLLSVQQRLAEDRVVMAGRDIGTVVVPDAELKIFLDAAPEVRAGRRSAELSGQSGTRATDLSDQLRHRDLLDSTRTAAPLSVPAGALRLMTDTLTLQAVIAEVLELAYRLWPDLRRSEPKASHPSHE